MKNIKSKITASAFMALISLSMFSCKKELTTEEKFLGSWSAQESFESIDCGNGNETWNTSIIKGAEDGEFLFTSLGGIEYVKFTLAGDKLIAQFQEGLFKYTGRLDFIKGTVTVISDKQIKVEYEYDDYPWNYYCGYYWGSATLTRQ